MDKQQELLDKIQKIKHNFALLIPTTIELMFDACIGILYEDFAVQRAELDAREKANGGLKSLKLGLLRANAESKLKRDRELVEYLQKRVTSIYAEVMDEPSKDQKETEKGTTRRRGPRKPTTDGEGGA
jgi:hypothetical protein